MKKSFTMIEIIAVIVIVSIIMGGTFDYLFRISQIYVRSNASEKMHTDLDIALTQILNRLSYRVKSSTIGYDINKSFPLPTSKHFEDVTKIDDLNWGEYEVLEWIGYDREGLMGEWNGTAIQSGWSGITDNSYRDTTILNSPNSNLNFAHEIIQTLSNGDVNLSDNTNPNKVALIFQTANDIDNNASLYGWHNSFSSTAIYERSYIFKVDKNITLDDRFDSDREFNSTLIGNDVFGGVKNKYYLSWSAYAIYRTSDANLTLCYNYRPWDGDVFEDGNCQPILKNVERFRFRQDGNILRIKICVDSRNSDEIDDNGISNVYSFCQERSIL